MVRTVDEFNANIFDPARTPELRPGCSLSTEGDVFPWEQHRRPICSRIQLCPAPADTLMTAWATLTATTDWRTNLPSAPMTSLPGIARDKQPGACQRWASTRTQRSRRSRRRSEVQFAHARDDGLTGLVIRGNTERRVFFSELLSAMDILSCSALPGSTAMGNDDHQRNLWTRGTTVRLAAQRVARGGVLRATISPAVQESMSTRLLSASGADGRYALFLSLQALST